MLKTAPLLLAAALACLTSTGCEKKKTEREILAEQAKARKEEKRQKAAQFYDELIKQFPDTEHVEEAKKRLQALGPVATPAGGKATPKR